MKENKNFTEFLFGKEHSNNLQKLYDELLLLENDNEFFNEENELSKYLVISYDPYNFRIQYREDLPKNIQDEITKIGDSIFKK